MYKITLYEGYEDVKGTVIHSPYVNDTKVQFNVDLVLKGVSSMEFTINPSCSMWGNIKSLTTLIKVENVSNNKLVFVGRVLMPTQEMSNDGMFTITYTCESKLAYLNDSRPRYAKIQNTSVYDSFAFFINRHNAVVPAHKQFKVGNVTVENSTDNVYKFVSYGNTMEEIQSNLIDKLGGIVRMREEVDGTYLDYLKEVGEVKNAPIRLKKNLQSMRREIDPTNIITHIIPLGTKLEANEGETADASMPRLDIKTVNNGLDYIEDSLLVAEFGIVEGVLELDDVNVTSILKLRGQQFFQQQRAAKISYDVSALNMNLIDKTLDEYEVGNWYPIENAGFAINEKLQVIGLKINGDSPQKSTLSIGEKQITLTDYQTIAKRSVNNILKIQEIVDRQTLSIATLKTSNTAITKSYEAMQVSYNSLATSLEIDSETGTSLALINLKTAIEDLGDIIPYYSGATSTSDGLMISTDKIKLDNLQEYTEATQSQSGLFSTSDKTKLDLVTVISEIDLDDLLARITALETI